MEKNNRLRILNILGGARDGGAEKFLKEYVLLYLKNTMFHKKL